MKKLILLVLVASAFLGGYYLGRLPGSPDVFGWSKRTYRQVTAWAGQAAAVKQPGRQVTAPARTAWLAFDPYRDQAGQDK